MKPQIYLSVVIPCYNEEENIKKGVLKGVYSYLLNINKSWEVIISDDGSTDKSVDLIKKEIRILKNFSLTENAHGGKPMALWHGIQNARGEYILLTDMDQSTPISELPKLMPYTIEDSTAAVIGSRGMLRKNFPIYRKLGAVIFIAIRKLMILSQINDTQCGFKLIKRQVLLKAFPKLEFFKRKSVVKGWKVTSYDVELLHIIEKMSGSIVEVGVAWEDSDTSSSKGGVLRRYIKESWEMLTQIIRVKINDLKGLYDIN